MTQVDQFFMSPPDQFLMSFDTLTRCRHRAAYLDFSNQYCAW